tara:strand:- start:3998 stop:5302 length:1305 start_codon:yes stop_codon:yes gene_type:complete
MSYIKFFFKLFINVVQKFNLNKKRFIFSTIGSLMVAFSIPFVLFPFITSEISLEEVGKLGVMLSIINFISNVITSSINQNLYRYHAELEVIHRSKLLKEIFVLNLILSAVAFLLLISLYPIFSNFFNLDKPYFWGLSIISYSFFLSIGWNFQVILSLDLKFEKIFIGQFFLFLLGPIALLIYFFVNKNLWFVSFFISSFFYFLVLFIFVFQNNKDIFREKIEFKNVFSHIPETVKWAIAGIFHNISLYADRWLLSIFTSNFVLIGIYNIMIQMLTFSFMIFDQLERVLTPIVSNLKDDFLSVKSDTYNSIKFLSPLVCIFFYLFFINLIPFVLSIFYDESIYLDGETIFNILMISTIFYPLQIISRGFLIRFMKIDLSLKINFVGVFFMIIVPILYILFGQNIDINFISFLRMLSISSMGFLAFFIVFFYNKKI